MEAGQIYTGNSLHVMRTFPDSSVHAVVTDPPYGLSFMGKDWDKALPDPRIWAECLRVLRPGGLLLSFGATRCFHRLAVDIEDTGFSLRDTLSWNFGSGFPKCSDVGKMIDKAAGAERDVVGVHHRHGGGSPDSASMAGPLGNASELPLTAPATPHAKIWTGFSVALKPAWEPILMFRKPMGGTVAEMALQYGTGTLNIDGCRVGVTTRTNSGVGKNNRATLAGGMVTGTETQIFNHGRWPPNMLLTHSRECSADYCVEDCPVRMLAEQSGSCPSSGNKRPSHGGKIFNKGEAGVPQEAHRLNKGDSGTAARYFPRFRYQAKAPTKERVEELRDGEARHPTVKPTELMRWLVRLVGGQKEEIGRAHV